MTSDSCSAGDCAPSEGGPEGSQFVEEWMNPSTIRFSQASISAYFSRRPLQSRKADGSSSNNSHGAYSEALKATPVQSIFATLQQLRDGTLSVEEFPRIRVCQHDGKWYTLDNRRLWVFQEFGKPIPVQIEEPDKEFFQKLSTENDGRTVRIANPTDKDIETNESESFLGIVLRWSVDDVLNDRMYVNKVQPIPLNFPNLQAYYKAFQWPLLDSIRGHVQHSVEAIGLAPYLALRSIEDVTSPNAKKRNQLRRLQLTKFVVGKNSVERNGNDAPWKPKPTDMVALCTLVPEDYEDLRRSGELYTFAQLQSLDADSFEDSLSFKVLAYLPEECPEFKEIREGKRLWYAVFLDSLATANRIWDALNPNPLMLKSQYPVVEETLYTENPQASTNSDGVHDTDDNFEAVLEKYCNFRGLNESQTEAVRCTVMDLLQDRGFRVRLVQGPPGTGKTSTLVALVSIVSCLMERILVCAPTNRAVSEIAVRFLQQLRSNLQDTCQFSDCTFPDSIGTRFCRPLQFGDVLLVGNEERLDTETILGEIFLPHRIRRLLEALAPHSGWRHSAQQVVNLLRDYEDEYDLYVELEKENEQKENDEAEKDEAETLLLDFLQFMRKRLNGIAPSMLRNGQIMCNDLSSKRLSDDAKKAIQDSCLVLERLMQALADDSLKATDLRDCFTGTCRSHDGGNRNYICPDICSAREKLLDIMTTQPGYFLEGYGSVPSVAQIEDNCLKDACLVFSTTSSAGRRVVKASGCFQYVVIDEAAQLVEAESAIVTQLAGIKRTLLVGDPKQLQASVFSQIAEESGYGRSLFERLQELGHPCHILNVQYRMHPDISLFPNRQFYNGVINDGHNVLSEKYKKPYQEFYGPYAFIDVRDGSEEKGEKGISWKNPVEAEVIQFLINKIRAVAAEKSESLDVGVIAPYKSQVELLMKRHYSRNTILPSSASFQVDVKTVDGFQGGEKDVILFSAVRANSGGHIGFVDNPRRLNVALTRGRYCVWIVGNSRTLAADNEMWRALVVDAKKRNCYWDAHDDQGLRKCILRVKKELEQFASLMHHDSILFRDTVWKITFSKEFKETITQIKSVPSRQTILNTILNLANGRRSPYPTKCNIAAEKYTKMIHVQPTAGVTLVWTIDVDKCTNPVKQVIKIWNAVESSYIPALIRRLEAGFSTYTGPYVDRCSTTNFPNKSLVFNRTRKVVVPATWKRDSSFTWHEVSECVRKRAGAVVEENSLSPVESRLEKASVDESILLMKFYSLTSGIARQLLTATDGSNMELLFEVNDEETAVIQYPFSTFILGRSGTGKTTVITTRLLKLEQQFRSAVNGFAIKSQEETDVKMQGVATFQAEKIVPQPIGSECLRQVIVTLSPKLCGAIKHHIAKTSRTMRAENSAAVTDNTDAEEDVMLDEEEEAKLMGGIPDTLVNIPPESFPLVITFRKFLAMVDGSVFCPFFVQDNSSIAEERAQFEGSESSSSDAEETANECLSLSEVEQEQEREDFDSNDQEDDEDSDIFSVDDGLAEEDNLSANPGRKQLENSEKLKERMTEVTFEHFISFYWPHFSQDLVKHFDSSVVFTEIISFIKGSLEALHTENGRLSREVYLSFAAKRISMFDERQRNSIYNVFLQYERYKAVRREYDIADFCTHLYGQLRLGNYVGLKFHYIYVDEVQDLTMAQIALFKYVCFSVEEGYVFAGDTAQTIARGVSFRFEDISHLFYTQFLGKGDNSLEKSHGKRQRALEDIDLNRGDSYGPTSSKPGKGTMDKTPHMPTLKLHHLSHNFRTHVGIVNIANSIVELLYNFFPNTVDKLAPESSLIQGETPIFLEREENHDSVTSLFGHGGAAGGGGCDFGAEQVILVRDMATKRQITEKLGKGGLVMSVLECKGLEFQDVLLYNFFSDSLLESKWRVIYSYMAENSIAEDEDGRPLSFPQFNMQKHNLLMSELKQLYVVVTRARQRLWIYDECPEHHKPMLNFWNKSGLIQVKRLDDDLIRTIHGKSTPEDWKRRGVQMFNDHHYDLAQISFERAGDLHSANRAKAAGLQQAGERQLGSDPKASAQLFREAATLFLSLGRGESAAKCHLKIGEDMKAGMIFRDSCKPPRLEEAGDCFMDAKSWSEAAEAYSKAWCFRQCLQACLKGKLLDLGAGLLHDWEQQLSSRNHEGESDLRTQVVDGDEFEVLKVDYLKKCALHCHKQRNNESMMKFVRRFPSVASQKVFLKRRDYFDELIEVEEGEGNFLKAAEMAEQKGDLKYTVQLLVQGGCHEQAVEKLLDRAMFTMLWSGGKPGWPLVSTAESEDLLERANSIIRSNSIAIRSDLIQELQLLLDPKSGLQNWNLVKGSNNIRHQIIAGRQVMDEDLLQSTGTNASFVPELLLMWDSWSQKLMSLIEALSRAQRRREKVEDEVFLHSSNKYLGVVKHSQPHLFVVTDVASSWLNNIQITRLPNQGQRGQVSSEQLFFLSEAFWVTQLWKAGLEVIKVLEVVLFNSNELISTGIDATPFATECFQPRGEQLCKLYSITKSLADIMSKNITQDKHLYLQKRLQRYGEIIFDASFPHRCNKESWCNVLTFREEVGAMYDNIATFLAQDLLALDIESGFNPSYKTVGTVQMLKPLLSTEWIKMYGAVGRILMLFPLLSRQWIRRYSTDVQNRLSDGWSNMWEKSFRMYYTLSEDCGQSPENVCETWVDAVEGYCVSLKKVYTNLRKTLSPFVFMQLLERGIVVDLACHTNLHSLILPESLVANHMTGDMNANLYTAILNVDCNCRGYCFQFTTIDFVLRLILDMLNSSSYQVEKWFEAAEIDWRVSLPSLIFRMLVVVLTVCINLRLDARTRGPNDRIIWGNAMTTLKTVLTNRSPLLQGQPPEFFAVLRGVLSSGNPHEGEVRVTFMKAMAAVKDPLTVLRHGGHGKRIAPWAHGHRLRRMFITHKRANGVVFGTPFSSRKKAVSLAKPKDVVINVNIPDSDMQIHGSQEVNGVPNPEFQKQDSGEANGRSVDNDARESVVPKTDSLVSSSDNVYAEEEMSMEEDEHPEDVWINDGSTEGPRLASRTIPAGHVSIGEGQTLPIFIKERLLQLLEDVQQRLKEELSATEKNRRDARTTFRKVNVERKEYFEFFLFEACPLKATADEWLRELETAVQALKDDDNFDEIADSQEALQKAVAILDPRNEEHVAQDLGLLEKKLEEARQLLETGKQRFQKQIDTLGTGFQDGKILSGTAEGVINTSANEAKTMKSQKRKPKEKRKKRKGKK